MVHGLTRADRLQRGVAILETLKYCRTTPQSKWVILEKCVVDGELLDVAICTEIDNVDQQVSLWRTLTA